MTIAKLKLSSPRYTARRRKFSPPRVLIAEIEGVSEVSGKEVGDWRRWLESNNFEGTSKMDMGRFSSLLCFCCCSLSAVVMTPAAEAFAIVAQTITEEIDDGVGLNDGSEELEDVVKATNSGERATGMCVFESSPEDERDFSTADDD
ncbi:hypothetical protein U1Q18_048694 [Sarracenia purpurea var. burkii]